MSQLWKNEIRHELRSIYLHRYIIDNQCYWHILLIKHNCNRFWNAVSISGSKGHRKNWSAQWPQGCNSSADSTLVYRTNHINFITIWNFLKHLADLKSKNLNFLMSCWRQCDQMWRFRAIWAIFRGPLALFFLKFIYCWALIGQNSYLLVAIFSWSLFTVGQIFVDNWALFHSNYLVTLSATQKVTCEFSLPSIKRTSDEVRDESFGGKVR